MTETGVVDTEELTGADIHAAAALHVRAFPRFFLSSLGERFLREYYHGFLLDPDAVTVVARTADGALAGIVVGSVRPEAFYRRLLRRRGLRMAVAAAWPALRSPRTALRLLRGIAYRGDVPVAAHGALLSSICVDPAVENTGRGRALIDRWWLRARQQGATSAYLVTDADDNDRVNAFYQRCGWTPVGSYLTREQRRMNCYSITAPADGS
ncbi:MULTISPECIES: GNAT family N-acetyltransferase [Micromonospora]|uniref:Acetyltransferase (GNAT) family protein n=1 Tax=Micromonospora yangpuensis TaxID=683228 RepID=A0A1C6UGW0_9ACTN|nr:GNAT family N-acetyltransferase [Micromonospora yangpuensis]GGM04625.1 hypothetical protein GCM10012279_22960 [Micromonospora yangpuensis]SCL53212.1 Acetyltransferase (GNAT) family protein [Micromonospora yangpuensis]